MNASVMRTPAWRSVPVTIVETIRTARGRMVTDQEYKHLNIEK
jgi:hypothetical protein